MTAKRDFTTDLTNGLVEDLFETIYSYEGTLTLAGVIGCLELVKAQLIEDHMYGDEDGGDTED